MKGICTLLIVFGSLLLKAQNLDSVQLYPNPYSTQVCLELDLIADDTISWQILDLTGKVLYEPYNKTPLTAGHQSRCLQNDSLKNGMYTHVISSVSGEKVARKVIKNQTETSINVSDEQKEFNTYPNPVTDVLSLSHETKEVNLFDLTGKLRFSSASGIKQLDIRNFPPGIYLLSGKTTEHGSITRRIIKR